MLRAFSLCTCCRHYPGAASGRTASLIHPAVSAFPERVVGSACASSVSRIARRSPTLRPAHSRGHQFVTRYPKASAISLPPWLLRLLPAGAVAGWALHPLEKRRLSTAHTRSGHRPASHVAVAKPVSAPTKVLSWAVMMCLLSYELEKLVFLSRPRPATLETILRRVSTGSKLSAIYRWS